MPLLLSACQTPFPAKYLYEVDLDNKVCGEYQVVDPEKLTFKHVGDLDLSACDGVFGFASKDISPVLNWTRAEIKKVENNCK